jgi:PTS system mannose-specific IIA component
MIRVVVAGHGKFPSQIISTAESSLGKQEHLKAISVRFGEGQEDLAEKLNVVLDMAVDDEVIVLSDLFGSSFCTGCVCLAESKGHIAVVTGVNLPMLLKVLTHRNRVGLTELVSLACEGGREGIRDACGLLNKVEIEPVMDLNAIADK